MSDYKFLSKECRSACISTELKGMALPIGPVCMSQHGHVAVKLLQKLHASMSTQYGTCSG